MNPIHFCRGLDENPRFMDGHYLNAEKRRLIAMVENLWDKYAVSSRELESQRAETLKNLEGFLQSLGYLEGTING
jgi:hypothetical protein